RFLLLLVLIPLGALVGARAAPSPGTPSPPEPSPPVGEGRERRARGVRGISGEIGVSHSRLVLIFLALLFLASAFSTAPESTARSISSTPATIFLPRPTRSPERPSTATRFRFTA